MNHDTKSAWCVRRRGCLRPECVARARRYHAYIQNCLRLGITQTIDVAPIREIVMEHVELGYSTRQLARIYGCNARQVTEIRRPKSDRKRVYSSLATKIFTAELNEPPMGEVPARGTTRRLRSLVRDGHSERELSELVTERLQMQDLTIARSKVAGPKWVAECVQGKYRHVAAPKARAVEIVFEKLVLTPGDSNFARSYGRKRGWPRPLALDPDTIDHPGPDRKDTEVWRCAVCERKLVTNHQYSKLTPEEREGVVQHAARGMCPPCAKTAQRRAKALTTDVESE